MSSNVCLSEKMGVCKSAILYDSMVYAYMMSQGFKIS